MTMYFTDRGGSLITRTYTGDQARSVAANAAADTYGSWHELTPSTLLDASGLIFFLTSVNGSDAMLFDIGIGGAGSETALISKIPFDEDGGGPAEGMAVYLPIGVPAGSRLSCRMLSAAANGLSRVQIHLLSCGSNGLPPCSAATVYGSTVTPSVNSLAGTIVDPGATPDTKGVWTELTAASDKDDSWLIVLAAVSAHGLSHGKQTMIDIGIGSAGNEIVVIPNLPLCFSFSNLGSRQLSKTRAYSFPVRVPSGTRISARAQSTISDAPSRSVSVAVIGAGG